MSLYITNQRFCYENFACKSLPIRNVKVIKAVGCHQLVQ
jgi:hypothetical protein